MTRAWPSMRLMSICCNWKKRDGSKEWKWTVGYSLLEFRVGLDLTLISFTKEINIGTLGF